jgi:hypothetical protein
LSHETYAPPLELPLSAAKHTAADLFRALEDSDSTNETWHLELDRDLVISLECTACNWHRDVMRPIQMVSIEEARCAHCDQVAKPRLEHSIPSTSPLVGKTLGALGVAPYDIVRIVAGDQHRTVLLADDRDCVLA